MAFTFVGFVNGGTDALVSEKRLCAVSGYAIHDGQALMISGGALIYADGANKVYAISKCSAASSVVTAAYKPEVFPVNRNQIWKGTIGSTITAAFLAGARTNLASSTTGTGLAGDEAAGSGMYIYNVVTASDPTTSAGYVVFPGMMGLVTG